MAQTKKDAAVDMKPTEEGARTAAVVAGDEIPGVDPESGEMVAVTVEGLQKRYGLSKQKAEDRYLEIASIDGGRHFFNPRTEPTNYRPALLIEGAKPDLRERINTILNSEG